MYKKCTVDHEGAGLQYVWEPQTNLYTYYGPFSQEVINSRKYKQSCSPVECRQYIKRRASYFKFKGTSEKNVF